MNEDSSNPLEAILTRVHAHVNRDWRAIADIALQDRYACAERGHHRVSDAPKESAENELMICYDCEVWFGSKDDWVKYKVEPL